MYRYQTITSKDKEYPILLQQIGDKPGQLFIRGTLPNLSQAVSIVGSRKHTDYGRNVTKDLASAAARAGVPVVSGLAYGIDAIAHQAAIEAGGITVAVLPCDISTVYPKAHEQLARRIIESGGAVISEMPVPTEPHPFHFLVRNRIIAGMSQMTVVTEAAFRSGALATARCAASYHRTVMAVPGQMYSSYSAGTNKLIASGGAGIILSADDMLRELGITSVKTNAMRYDKETQRLLAAIPRSGISLQELANQLQLDIVAISSKVILLEINGLIAQVGDGMYRRLI
jgi:DNA processing protein